MLKSEQVEQYKTALMGRLGDEGFRPTANTMGDIEFKCEGKLYILDFDDNDPGYMRLLLPHFWSIDDPRELHAAYIAASQACERCKGVKVFVEGASSVWASVEFLANDIDVPTTEMLDRYLAMIRSGTRTFAEKIDAALKGLEEQSRAWITH